MTKELKIKEDFIHINPDIEEIDEIDKDFLPVSLSVLPRDWENDRKVIGNLICKEFQDDVYAKLAECIASVPFDCLQKERDIKFIRFSNRGTTRGRIKNSNIIGIGSKGDEPFKIFQYKDKEGREKVYFEGIELENVESVCNRIYQAFGMEVPTQQVAEPKAYGVKDIQALNEILSKTALILEKNKRLQCPHNNITPKHVATISAVLKQNPGKSSTQLYQEKALELWQASFSAIFSQEAANIALPFGRLDKIDDRLMGQIQMDTASIRAGGKGR